MGVQVKVAAASAVGAWLPLAKQLPPPVVKHFEAGLRDKEALKRANLRCLAKVGAGLENAVGVPSVPYAAAMASAKHRAAHGATSATEPSGAAAAV